MPFSEGQIIVHPHHGLVRVKEITYRLIRGTPTRYYELTTLGYALGVSVPTDQAVESGLREVSSLERVVELLDILRAPGTLAVVQWSRRLKDYQMRLSSGSLEDRCIVIRDIIRSGVKPPASAEGMMLRSTRASLGLEFAVALDLTPAEAEAVIDSTARGEFVDVRNIPAAAVA